MLNIPQPGLRIQPFPYNLPYAILVTDARIVIELVRCND